MIKIFQEIEDNYIEMLKIKQCAAKLYEESTQTESSIADEKSLSPESQTATTFTQSKFKTDILSIQC